MSIIRLEKPKPQPLRKLAAPKASGDHVPRRGRRSHIAAASGVMLVALALLGPSLSQLAAIVTGSDERDGWLPRSGSILASPRWNSHRSPAVTPRNAS
jgi:hypothetical protein